MNTGLQSILIKSWQGRSPFKADRQHLHHRLLQLQFTHLQATLILISVNLFFIVLSYLLRGIGIVSLMGVIVGLASMMTYILVKLVERRANKLIEVELLLAAYLKKLYKRKEKPLIKRIEKIHFPEQYRSSISRN